MISDNPKSYYSEGMKNIVISLTAILLIRDPTFMNIFCILHWLLHIRHISPTVFFKQFEVSQKSICLCLLLFIPTLDNTFIDNYYTIHFFPFPFFFCYFLFNFVSSSCIYTYSSVGSTFNINLLVNLTNYST